MRVNYIDLGLYRGQEIGIMANVVFPALGITDYEIHGFEACKSSYNEVARKYNGSKRIHIHHLAVGGKKEMMKLYYCVMDKVYHPAGNSLFATKNNVGEKFEEVQCVVLSDWLDENVTDWRDCVNILRMNIEGAEWHVMTDLRDKGLLGCFKAYCGSRPGIDLKKVGELEHHYDDFQKMLEENGIKWGLFFEDKNAKSFIDYLKDVL